MWEGDELESEGGSFSFEMSKCSIAVLLFIGVSSGIMVFSVRGHHGVDDASKLVGAGHDRDLRPVWVPARYRDRVTILRSVPGIGLIAAMEILLELQGIERFQRAEQLAAHVGLTPSQYSTGEQVRMGHITGIGKNSLRGVMVEVSWRVIVKDPSMRREYEA